MEKLRKKGQAVTPVQIAGRAIATTFWGKAWCDNLESYSDYENRLPRGRTYVRNGSVVDLQVAPREVRALVSGSEIYRVTAAIGAVAPAAWRAICAECAGGIGSLVELLQGRFSKGVMERLCRQGGGLFPKPSEIRFTCSCPDHATLCKHVAAVLYGIGARLDAKPELLFRLRAVDAGDLVAGIGEALPASKQAPAPGRVLAADDLAAIFDLDIAATEDREETKGGGAAAVRKAGRAPRGPRSGRATPAEAAPGQVRKPGRGKTPPTLDDAMDGPAVRRAAKGAQQPAAKPRARRDQPPAPAPPKTKAAPPRQHEPRLGKRGLSSKQRKPRQPTVRAPRKQD
ncbi:MAG: SWIM zinc finger family protein [Acetobacteraceae bacterium]